MWEKNYENWYFLYGTNKALLLLSNLSEFKQGLDMHTDNKSIQKYPELIWLFHAERSSELRGRSQVRI